MDITGIGEVATAAQKILSMIFPDKTQQEKDQLAAAMAMLSAQTDIDKAEAQSTDPLQHWRGGLGWVCVCAYAWEFVLKPATCAVLVITHHADMVAMLPAMNMTDIGGLTLGMLGLGTMHVYQQVNK